ncbi:MAG: hypothetical protein JWN86_3308 [Planctomycetota bacterium]|nr:hypothetical protein [Planctomycetota bacterium]
MRTPPVLAHPSRWSFALLLVLVARVVLADEPPPRRVAALVTEYRHNSHADVIVSRLLLTDMLDGTGRESPLKLASLYTDQKPPNDISRLLAASHRFPIKPSIAETLTLGTGKLAVEGVLLVAEHGNYPFSATGNHQYPKKRFWDETIKVFRQSGRVVPVFIDKHLSDNWQDAKAIYDTARELKIPLMAGSSVSGSWRHPAADVARDARVSEIVAFTYGTTDAYGFHGLEAVQALAEQRRGGETGVRSVQCLSGDDVWKAMDERMFDPELFAAALKRAPGFESGKTVDRKAVPKPLLMIVEYEDGLRVFLLELNGAVNDWTAAWRYQDDRRIESTRFWTQEARPAAHFSLLLDGIETMMRTGTPTWPVERTLLTSGVLDALLQSQTQGGKRIVTPYLHIAYQPTWRWKQPPPPPPGRPWSEQ